MRDPLSRDLDRTDGVVIGEGVGPLEQSRNHPHGKQGDVDWMRHHLPWIAIGFNLALARGFGGATELLRASRCVSVKSNDRTGGMTQRFGQF